MNQPAAQTSQQALHPELPRVAEIPSDLDPLADGILMAHQKAWLEDKSELKIAEKGRRTGITFAEALDDTLIAMAAKSAGGDNVFYIGDTKDKGREFIGYVAHFAKVVAGELHEIEEYVFKDERPDGTSKDISAYRITFNSGFRVEALSSNPANIRGLQGVVVIDEAAFHRNVREVIDAVNALLIWGGKVRVISTHNGALSPFNELIQEARAGRNNFEIHHIPFQAAVDNGLYKRVCLVRGKTWSPEAQAAWEESIRSSYGSRTAQMRQELDAIPTDSEGAALSRVQIERCMAKNLPIVRWSAPDSLRDLEPSQRRGEVERWCDRYLAPILAGLDQTCMHYLGQDFARSGDLSAIKLFEQARDLTRIARLTVEMRNVPFEVQRDVLFHILDRTPRFMRGAIDKTGNGAYLAEVAAQRYGSRIIEVSMSRAWYETEMPPYIEAFEDATILLPKNDDILMDHQALQFAGGIIKVPEDFRFKGSDGQNRHGDTAIAGALGYFASRQDPIEYDYRPVKPESSGSNRMLMRPPEDAPVRDPYESPMGARLRGSI